MSGNVQQQPQFVHSWNSTITMWLINTSTLRLERFEDETKLPDYAILSHTWGEQEVSFEQMNTLEGGLDTTMRRIRGSRGYKKIQRTCMQARSDELDYAWVDTCCIDKRSSAELSEAINSMFRWYQKASVCYAYLDDVDERSIIVPSDYENVMSQATDDPWDDPFAGMLGQTLNERELAPARWFTRGWTLQELIAPSNVVFFGKRWASVGTKITLSGALANITRIDEAVLCGANLESFSVARRMSWAADRVTTRVEDLAYSLLGIFDVNMPLLYGEGEKAFVRLQEEIMKDSSDESLFAWVPTVTNQPITPMSPDKWGPVFASHPREYASSTIAPLRRGLDDYSLTNQGVKIDIPVLPMERKHWNSNWLSEDKACFQRILEQQSLLLVVLNCYYTSDLFFGQRVAIVCQRINKSGHQLVRHNSAPLIPIDEDDLKQARRLNVYLLKKMPAAVRTYDRRDSVTLQNALHDLERALDDACSPPPLFMSKGRRIDDFLLAPAPLRTDG